MNKAQKPVTLTAESLTQLDDRAEIPTYNRSLLRKSIVHVGVGGFHRAHFATYIDELCRQGNQDWAIVGAGILESDAKTMTALQEQDYLYCLASRGPGQDDLTVIGSIVDYIHAYPEAEPLVEKIAEPETQIVSLTITEGGYPVDDQSGKHLPESPQAGPKSTFGIIASALDRRRKQGGEPMTIISFDNIANNGKTTAAATLGEAKTYGPELVTWIQDNVSFPNSMVDRITIRTQEEDISWLLEQAGIQDNWPVITEPFRQWVVEDSFLGDRLPLEDLDVVVTDDVEPYEAIKLQLLNASHSCLAYLSALLGIEHIHAAMQIPELERFMMVFLRDEAAPTLTPVPGIDLADYQNTLKIRYSNPQIADRIDRLALDGSVKFPKFLIPTIQAQLAADGPIKLGALSLAAWCRYLNGTTDSGERIELSTDPNLEKAVKFAQKSADNPQAFLGFRNVFPSELAANRRFSATFAQMCRSLDEHGVLKTLKAELAENKTSD